jgi:hypothetical protein
MIKETKESLLEKYATKEPTEFLQIDWFTQEDDFQFTAGMITELMSGSDIRLLIKPETKKADVIHALCLMIDWISRDYEGLLNINKDTEDFIKRMRDKYNRNQQNVSDDIPF